MYSKVCFDSNDQLQNRTSFPHVSRWGPPLTSLANRPVSDTFNDADLHLFVDHPTVEENDDPPSFDELTTEEWTHMMTASSEIEDEIKKQGHFDETKKNIIQEIEDNEEYKLIEQELQIFVKTFVEKQINKQAYTARSLATNQTKMTIINAFFDAHKTQEAINSAKLSHLVERAINSGSSMAKLNVLTANLVNKLYKVNGSSTSEEGATAPSDNVAGDEQLVIEETIDMEISSDQSDKKSCGPDSVQSIQSASPEAPASPSENSSQNDGLQPDDDKASSTDESKLDDMSIWQHSQSQKKPDDAVIDRLEEFDGAEGCCSTPSYDPLSNCDVDEEKILNDNAKMDNRGDAVKSDDDDANKEHSESPLNPDCIFESKSPESGSDPSESIADTSHRSSTDSQQPIRRSTRVRKKKRFS